MDLLAAGILLAHDTETWDRVPKCSDLVVEIGSIPFLDHVVCGLLDGAALCGWWTIFLVVVLDAGLALATVLAWFRGGGGRVG